MLCKSQVQKSGVLMIGLLLILLSMSFVSAELNYTTGGAVYSDFNYFYNSEGVYSNTTNLLIGNVNGSIDEVMIFNRSLSADEIKDIYYTTNPTFEEYVNLTINATITDEDTLIADLYYRWLVGGVEKLVGFAESVFNWVFGEENQEVVLEVNDTSGYEVNQSWNISTTFVNPAVISLTEPSDPATYSLGTAYEFNATITDANLQTVLFEFDGTNYTPSSSGNVYNYSISGLSAGTYNYIWYANDSVGNVNNTETGSYTINKANPATNMAIAGTTPIEYPATSDFAESETNTGDGGCSYSMDLSNVVYGVGVTTFNYSTSGCANYTAGSITKDLTVTQNTSLVLSITGTTPITYGTTTNVAGGSCPTELSCALDKSNIVYGVGTETFNYSTSGNTNYSETSIIKVITINQATPTGSLTSDLGWTINETQSVTIALSETNTGDGDLTYIVYRDGASKSTGETWSPAYGTYNYVLNTTGGTNYTANSSMDTETLTVLDNINPDVNLTYPLNQTYNTNVSSLNYTYTETNCDSVWWSNSSGTWNSSRQDCGTNWTNLTSTEGSNTWTIYINDSSNNLNSSSVTFFKDTISTSITLTSPEANSADTDGVVRFIFTPTDTNNITNCSLICQNGIYTTSTSISNGISNVIEVVNIDDLHVLFLDNLQWSINCTDEYNNVGNSSTRNLDTKEDQVGDAGGGGGGGGGGGVLVSTLQDPKSIDLFYPEVWNRDSEVELIIKAYNQNDELYSPEVLLNFSIDGVKLKESKTDFFNQIVNTFKISKTAEIGEHKINIQVKDEKIIERDINIIIEEKKEDKTISLIDDFDKKFLKILLYAIGGLVVLVFLIIIMTAMFSDRKRK